MESRVAAIVPAAGLSRRFGVSRSKPLVSLYGHPLLAHTLRALQDSQAVGWIIPVIREQDRKTIQRLVSRYHLSKVLQLCTGGASRAESVRRGAAALPTKAKWVLVHDGARPCVTPALIEQVVQEARRRGAAVCGLPAPVTVKAVDAHHQVRLTLDRDTLWFVQTPQVFRRDWFEQSLAAAHRCLSDFPDDAAIVEAAGFSVQVIAGDPGNLKVTTPEDLLLAEAILKSRNGHAHRHRVRYSPI